MYELAERFTATKPRLLRLLAEFSECRRTVYLTADALNDLLSRDQPDVSEIVRQAGDSDTGLAIFFAEDRVVAVVPPFPILADRTDDGLATGPLADILERDRLIGVVLLRLGRYVVGVLRQSGPVASKTGSRYVKRRHRAGGSSQRRFERSRERLVRELFDKACEVVARVFAPYNQRIDHVLLGGERNTLRDFTRRCRHLTDLESRTLARILRVDRPGQRALERLPAQLWESRVYLFEGGPVRGEPFGKLRTGSVGP